jgi:hypothetical protein
MYISLPLNLNLLKCQVHKNLKEPYPSVLVPTPRTPLCAKRVLVMEDLSPATKLADGLRKEASKVEKYRIEKTKMSSSCLHAVDDTRYLYAREDLQPLPLEFIMSVRVPFPLSFLLSHPSWRQP